MKVKVTIPAESYDLIIKADEHEKLTDEEIDKMVLDNVKENVGFNWKRIES